MGSRDVAFETIWKALTDLDAGSASETVIARMRVPRTLLGLTVGAALGLSGTILQGVTRNPLADPGIMGINAGAAAAVVLGVTFLGVSPAGASVWLAFLGAAIAMIVVYGVASFGREGATPVKLALAGAAVTAGLASLTTAMVMTDVDALDAMRFWQVGSLAGRYMPVFWQTLPFIVVGSVIAIGCGRALNGLALGEDVAIALGQRVRLTRFVLFATVALLCGAATAACGPIVFVGLVVPHLARMVCGPDYRWILPYALVLTPIVLLLADIVGRVVIAPSDLQVGVVLGVLGAPAFIALVRRRDLTIAVSLDHALPTTLRPTEVRRSVVADRASRHRRTILITTGLGGIAMCLFVLTMMVGSFPISAPDVLASLLHLRSDESIDFVVRELRFPTAATGLGVGLALGVAGLIFQRLLANPLASPDLVGVSSGASLFAIGSIILVGWSSAGVSLAALVGALVSCGLVYVLTWRDGISGFRFILIGIGVSEFMLSIVGYLIARADISDAREAMTWLVGFLGQAGMRELTAHPRVGGDPGPGGHAARPAARHPRARRRHGRGARAAHRGQPSGPDRRGHRARGVRNGRRRAAHVHRAHRRSDRRPCPRFGVGRSRRGRVRRGHLRPGRWTWSPSTFCRSSLLTGVVTGAIGAPYLIWLLATTGREGRGG